MELCIKTRFLENNMKFEYVFFDLDGTLTDSQEGILNSFRNLLTHYGREIPDYKTLCTFIGPPLVKTMTEAFGFSSQKALESIKVFRSYYDTKGYKENRVYDGIEELLSELKKRGLKLSVATSKPEVTAKMIIKHFNLEKYFDFVCGSGADESRSKKSEVIEYALESNGIKDRSKVLMVGDRKFDVEGAKATGLKCAGLLVGYGNRRELEEAGADFIAEKPADILNFLD